MTTLAKTSGRIEVLRVWKTAPSHRRDGRLLMWTGRSNQATQQHRAGRAHGIPPGAPQSSDRITETRMVRPSRAEEAEASER